MDRHQRERKDDRGRRERRHERKKSRSRSRSPSRSRDYREREHIKDWRREKEHKEERRRARGREKLSVLAKLGIELKLPERGAQRLLWSNKPPANNWEAAKFGDGRVTAKFQRLMGMKEAAAAEGEDERQEQLFKRMEADYEAARQATHSLRRAGLGFSKAS